MDQWVLEYRLRRLLGRLLVCWLKLSGVLQCMFCHSFIDRMIRKWRSRAAAADSLLVFQKESRGQGRLTSRSLVDERRLKCVSLFRYIAAEVESSTSSKGPFRNYRDRINSILNF
jgi:hypothetical protein